MTRFDARPHVTNEVDHPRSGDGRRAAISGRAGGVVLRVVAAGTIALTLAGCGGGADETAVAPASSAEPVVLEGAELAGVHFDVRRDPG